MIISHEYVARKNFGISGRNLRYFRDFTSIPEGFQRKCTRLHEVADPSYPSLKGGVTYKDSVSERHYVQEYIRSCLVHSKISFMLGHKKKKRKKKKDNSNNMEKM